MNSAILHIDYTNTTGSGGAYWLKMELVEKDDSVGRAEIAEIVDTLYEIEPCGVETREADAEQPVGLPFTLQKFTEVIKDKLDPTFCDEGQGASYVVQVKVWKSHQDEPYRLQMTNGRVGGTIKKQELVKEVITLSGADSALLSQPPLSISSVQVSGSTLVDDTEQPIAMIATATGLEFSSPVYGSMMITYLTEYDLVNVSVFGDADGFGTSLILAFYHGLVVELSVSPPSGLGEDWIDRESYCGAPEDPSTTSINVEFIEREDNITCYERVTYQNKCKCSGGIANEWTEDVIVTCPERLKQCPAPGSMFSDSVEEDDHYKCSAYMGSRTVFADYVDCDIVLYDPMHVERARTSDVDPNLPRSEYYEEQCCLPPSADLPQCKTTYEKNPGGKSVDSAIVEKYRNKWDNRVEFIGITPKDNDCGTTKTIINDAARSCCEFVEPLVIDEDSVPSAISDNSQGLIYLSSLSGRPFTVTVRGEGFFANKSLTSNKATYNNNSSGFWVYTGNACGVGDITVDDGCSIATTSVKATDGQWVKVLHDWRPDFIIGINISVTSNQWIERTTESISGKYKVSKQGVMCNRTTKGVESPIQFFYSNQFVRDVCIEDNYPLCRYTGPTNPPIGHDPGDYVWPGMGEPDAGGSWDPVRYWMSWCSAWMVLPSVRWNVWEWKC